MYRKNSKQFRSSKIRLISLCWMIRKIKNEAVEHVGLEIRITTATMIATMTITNYFLSENTIIGSSLTLGAKSVSSNLL